MQSLKQQMPDMIYEAMAKDYTKRKNNHYNSAVTAVVVPQPDYDDSTLSKKYDDVPPYVQVPTPDYNTYGRSNKNNPQPDSPVYTRKSPHHLIVDYETDSLERSSTKFSRSSVSPPMLGQQSNSSDLSSQPSPSLSNALPLEEEVEVRHTVYDRVEGFRKDGVDFFTSPRISFSNLLAPPKEPRIKYNTPSQGSMTIEVEHSPSEYELSTDSEQFEPDTLDRKTKKLQQSQQPSETVSKNVNVNLWSQHLLKANNFLNESDEQQLRYSSLENVTSLPDLSLTVDQHQSTINGNSQLILRSSGSFKSNSLSSFASANTVATNRGGSTNESRLQKNFNSLREIYEAKNLKNLQNNNNINVVALETQQQQPKPQPQQFQQKQRMLAIEKEKGRLLTLEARHSRRQRQTNGVTTLKKPVPPDVVPSAGGIQSIYDSPKQLISNYELVNSPPVLSKNLSGWNTGDQHSARRTANDDYITMRHQQPKQQQQQSDGDTLSSTTSSSSSNSGESTAITGVSDTYRNSSDRGSAERKSTISSSKNSTTSSRKYSQVQKKQPKNSTMHQEQHPPIEILKNFMSLGEVRNTRHLLDASEISDFSDTSTLKSGSTNFCYKRNGDGSPQAGVIPGEDMDKIEIVSSKSLSIHNVPISHNTAEDEESPTALMQELTSHQQHSPMTLPATKVFRVEVNPSTHGMQIALGLKDRVRKSKDLKYAWKRFVNIATSKFQGSGSGGSTVGTAGKSGSLDALDKSSVLSDGDEGISSLHDDSLTVLDEPRSKPTTHQVNVSRTPSVSSDVSVRPNARCDPDSGYMSADSNESKMNSKKLYERFNFRASSSKSGIRGNQTAFDTEVDFAQKNMNRMQEIKETTQEQERSHSRTSSLNQQEDVEQNKNSTTQSQHHKPSVTGFIPKRKAPLPGPQQLLQQQQQQKKLHQLQSTSGIEPIEVNVFSSDDDGKFSSSGEELESETDDEELSMDEMCESGAESVETNSVFFKNVRKTSVSNNNNTNHNNSVEQPGYGQGSSKKS